MRLRQVLVGGLVAAALWTLLGAVGASYISKTFRHTNHLYGVFAIVLVTMAWFYLQSVILMLAAEINAVLEYRLWPRSLLTPFTDDVELTGADRRAYRQYAEAQQFRGFETVTDEFDSVPDGTAKDAAVETAPGEALT